MEVPETTVDSQRSKRDTDDIKLKEKLMLAVEKGDKKTQASACDGLAWSHYHKGDYEESKKYGQNLLNISKEVEDETLEASAHSVLAWSYKQGKDFTKSEKHGDELLRISLRLKNKKHEASAYHVLAWSHFHKKDYKRSQTVGKKFKNVSEKLGDKKLEANACDVLAWSYYNDENYELCKEYGGKVQSISKELGDRKLEGYACDILAWLCYDAGDYEKSEAYGQELLKIGKELGDKKQELQACDILAWSYYDAGDIEKSKKYGQELLSISEKLDTKGQKAQAYGVLAKSYYKETDYEQSKTYGHKFLSISQELEEREQEANAYELLTELYYEEKEYEQSKTYCKELLTISEELRIEKLIAKARNFLARLNSELDKFEQNKQSSEKSLSIAKGVKEKNLEAEACGGTELPERHIFNLLRQIEQQAKEDTNNHETGLSENFKRKTKEKGFSISDNQGEGNCMFLALSEQLHLKKGIKISQAELRQTVVQYLKKNSTLLDGTELFHFVDGYSSWDAYLTRMMADGTWGDHVILHGAANHFQTCIHVISSHHDEVMICPEYDASTRLVLGHVHELHYVSLIPHKGDIHVPQGGKKPSFEQIGMPWYADKDDNVNVGESRSVITRGVVASEGTSWALKLGGVHLIFPPNAVSERTSTVVYRWKSSVCSPPLQEHEAIVSNVIELSSHDGQRQHFNAMVTLSLSHSAPNLRGYEVVIKRQINKETNEWEDVRGTKNLSCRPDIEAERPCHKDISDLFFPVAEAEISDCSTYAVVCRLKSSPNYTITSTGGLFCHPDYPGVKITIPKNAVAPESRFTLKFEAQEVPNEDFEEEGVFHGPILRIKCCEVVQFLSPVTIQLPVSLRDRQDVKLDPSKYHVRVFFLNCEEEKKKWTEPTDLVEPTQFDGKFVRIQHKIQRLSRYSFCVERREENSGAYGLRNLTYLTRSTGKQYRRPAFVAYFDPGIPEILTLICCSNHLRQGVIEYLEEKHVECADGSSMKDMIPGEDKAFVFLSGGMRPFDKKDLQRIYLRLFEEHPFKTALRVRLVDSKDLAQVEFRNTLKQTDGTHLLCKLHLTSPSHKMPRAEDQNSRELAPQHDSQSTASSDGAKKQKGDLSTEEPASKISKTTSSSNPSDADDAEDATSGISNDETKCRKTDSNPPEVDVAVLTNKELPKTSKRLDLEQLPIDILLLTVKDCEFLACVSLLTGLSRMFQKDLGDVYIGNIGEMKIAVMKCRMGAAGPGSAAGVVRDAVKALTPKAVFCVGYCGGLQPVKVKLGDVVISEVLIRYAPSKVTKDGIEERGDRVPLKPNLAKVILNAAAGWSAPLRDPAELEVALVRGALLSGAQVVDDSDLREALLNRFPGTIAIEMEGEGVYSAAHDLNVEWIIIKGVSDFADGKNSEKNAWRRFGSIMAASFVAHILSNPIIFEDWPHYNN